MKRELKLELDVFKTDFNNVASADKDAEKHIESLFWTLVTNTDRDTDCTGEALIIIKESGREKLAKKLAGELK